MPSPLLLINFMILQNHDFNFIAYPLVSIKLANTILPTICSNSFYPYVIHLNQQTDLFVVALLFWGASIFENLHDFRYEGGAPINTGFQIPLVIEKKEYGIDLCFVGCQRLRVSVIANSRPSAPRLFDHASMFVH